MNAERSQIGWVAEVPPNGFRNRPSADIYASNDNPLGLATPDNELETTPEHRNLAAGDPACATWTRRHDDPSVVAYRERLARENGIRGLAVVAPHEVERAAQLFHRDGFVVVRDALTHAQTARLRAATDRALDRILAVDPQAAVGGGAGGRPHRYSFGASSASRHMLHELEWCEVIDLPTIRQIPGSQRSRQPIPTLADEPEWMKFSTICPVPAGSAIFRDNRCWHGGTPNLSRDTRAITNIEYFAPWFRSEALIKSMPYERWAELSPHAKRISRYIAGYPGEPILGAGFVDPRAAKRARFNADQLAGMDPIEAVDFIARR